MGYSYIDIIINISINFQSSYTIDNFTPPLPPYTPPIMPPITPPITTTPTPTLGSTISIVIGMDRFYSICGSALAVVVYTTLGGMNSVAVTDVVQLLFLTFGLVSSAIVSL